MTQPATHPDARRGPARAERDHRGPDAALRTFQVLAAVAGAALFVIGLLAVFQVNFGDAWTETTAEVVGLGMNAITAVAALVLGGAILVASVADQDRGSSAILGLLTLFAGIAGLIAQDNPDANVQIDHGTATAFVVLGALVFVLSLVPWWSRRGPGRS